MTSSHSTLSAYDRYRPQLTTLAEGTLILKAIEFIGNRQSWWKPSRRWAQTFARFDPDRSPFVTFLYETTDTSQEICTVHVFEECPSPSKGEPIALGTKPEMWIRTTRFPNDPKLPNLHHVLTSPNGHPTVVRYRPGKRCTLRFDASDTRQSCFAKVFRDNQGALIHEESQTLWDASCQGKLEFSVAEPIKWDATRHTLWQRTVEGQPIVETLAQPEGVLMAERVGNAVGSITLSGLRPQTVFDGNSQMERSRRYGQDLSKRVPDLSDALARLLDDLSTIHEKFTKEPRYPIHGAPHAHQWLDDGKRLGLVDFDRFSFGDRELDAATFITELEFEGHSQNHLAKVKEAFQRAYESVTGPLHPSLFSAYRAHKCLAKSYKASRSVRPDGAHKATRYLQKTIHTS